MPASPFFRGMPFASFALSGKTTGRRLPPAACPGKGAIKEKWRAGQMIYYCKPLDKHPNN